MSFAQGAPTQPLSLVASNVFVTGSSTTGNAFTVQQLSTGNVFSAQTSTGATAMIINGIGNVGVGTNNPATKLDVYTGTMNASTVSATSLYGTLYGVISVSSITGNYANITSLNVSSVYQTLPVSQSWSSITYASTTGIFVAVASGSSTGIYSINNGITWSTFTLPGSSLSWTSVATDGYLNFVAIASGTSTAAYSTNGGITWSTSTMPVSQNWLSVTYGQGSFWAVGNGATGATVAPGGSTWTSFNMPSSQNWNNIAYNGTVFAAISGGPGTSSSSTFAYSSNGSSWSGVTVTSSNWNTLAVSPSYFIATSWFGITIVSTNGSTWTAGGNLPGSWQTSMTYGGGNFIVHGLFSALAAYSTNNGTSWTSGTTTISSGITKSAYGGGVFIGLQSGSAVVYNTSTGASWGTSGNLGVSVSGNVYVSNTIQTTNLNASYVGIGTTSPSALLHVNATATTTGTNIGLFLQPSIPTGGGQINLQLGTSTTTAQASVVSFLNYGGNTSNILQLSLNGYFASSVNINSTGVGIGTTNPGYLLQVQGNQYVHNSIYVNNNGNAAPALSVGDQGIFDNGSAYGTVNITRTANDVTRAHLAFIRNGNYVWQMSYVYGTNHFGIGPASWANSTTGTPTMTWTTGGNVGIGTSNPAYRHHVYNGDASVSYYGPNTTWGAYLVTGASGNLSASQRAQVIVTNGNLHIDCGQGAYQIYLNFYQGGGAGGTNATVGCYGAFFATGDITAFYSDERLKTKTGTIENALDKVCSLNAFKYVHNDIARQNGFDGDEVHVGLSAQEVQKVLPEVVARAPFDMGTDYDVGLGNSKTGENYLTIKYERMVPLLVEALKEERAERLLLQDRLERLEKLLLQDCKQ